MPPIRGDLPPALALLLRLEPGQDMGRDTAAIADFDTACLSPCPDLRAAVPVGRRPPPPLDSPERALARVLSELTYNVAELLAVLRA